MGHRLSHTAIRLLDLTELGDRTLVGPLDTHQWGESKSRL